MRYITSLVLLTTFFGLAHGANTPMLSSFGVAPELATFHFTSGAASTINTVLLTYFSSADCSTGTLTENEWGLGGGLAWNLGTKPVFGVTQVGASFNNNGTLINSTQSISISFASNTRAPSNFSGSSTYCVQNVSCTVHVSCVATPTPSTQSFTMD